MCITRSFSKIWILIILIILIGGGILGYHYWTSRQEVSPQKIEVEEIAIGYYHTCARLNNGTIKCWGDNSYGQLGNNTTTASFTPALVSGISDAIQIATGYYHSCALLKNGTINCWGDNRYGQLGNGTLDNSSVPVLVSGIDNAVQITAGGDFTCGLLNMGKFTQIKCWGNNQYGQLGNSTTIPASVPSLPVERIGSPSQVTAGWYHACGIAGTLSGIVYCWGYNGGSQGGGGVAGLGENYYTIPIQLASGGELGIKDVIQITAGCNHSCALLKNKTFRCWGQMFLGQTGDETRNDPVHNQLSAGCAHTCAVLIDGKIKCSGANEHGQLGNGATSKGSRSVFVTGITNAIQVAAGVFHTCATLNDGTAKCWGSNDYGQLGDGTTNSSLVPVLVSGIK